MAWGDLLHVEPAQEFTLVCDDPSVPVDETNLVLKAAQAFRAATSWSGGAKFTLEKRIPMGAGMGGGSSDAVAALRGLNGLAGNPLNEDALEKLGAGLGSDCPLFLRNAPVVMRGRGERIEPLPESVRVRLSGKRVLIFKPPFGISTPWAYGRLVSSAPQSYLPPADAEARLARWLGATTLPPDRLHFNSFEPPAFTKFIALPVLLRELRTRFDFVAGMTGSGSACFGWLNDDAPVAELLMAIREAWGIGAFTVDTRLA